MKKLLVLILLLTIPLHLCSCSVLGENKKTLEESYVEYPDESNAYETYIEKESTYEHDTSKEILSREINYFPDIKVKEHTYESTRKYELLPEIIRFKTKYLYLYANSHAEEIFNLINARDKDALMQMFSPYQRSINSERFSWEIDVLFKYIGEAILDYDEDRYPMTSSEHYSYGECLETVISADITAHTESTDYFFHISYTLADEDEEAIGLSWISVSSKEVDDYWTNDPPTDNKPYGTSDNPNICVQCQCKDYHFGVDGVPVYD